MNRVPHEAGDQHSHDQKRLSGAHRLVRQDPATPWQAPPAFPAHSRIVSLGFILSVVSLAVEPVTPAHSDGEAPIWLKAPVSQTNSPEEEYPLRPEGDGFVYTGPSFEARVTRDGLVIFQDRPAAFDYLGAIRRPVPPPDKDEILEGLFFGRTTEPSPPVAPLERPPHSPAERLELSEICPPESCFALPDNMVVAGAGVTMDLSDEITRALGEDPYRAEKARFLAATFEERMKLAAAAWRDDIRKSVVDLPDALADLWGDPRHSARERRRILFEIWRETDNTPEGVRAANEIELFIQRKLPCGSPDAYTASELQGYRGQQAGRAFSPYGSCKR
jgi:hypothetical protein